MPRILQIILCLFMLFFQALKAEPEILRGKEIKQAVWKGQEIEHIEGEIVVRLKDGVRAGDLEQAFTELGVVIVHPQDKQGVMLLEGEIKADIFETITQLEANQAVEFAEPNMVRRLWLEPNDPYFDKQWHYHNVGQFPPGGTYDADIDLPEGLNFSGGDPQIIIGVLDTGIPISNGQLSHPDLDDPARYIPGINIYPDSLPRDDNGHGTHVIGTIAAETNNGLGVAGVAGGCRIRAIKVFSETGVGSDYGLYLGIIDAVDNGCRVINYSGGGASSSSAVETGIEYADSNGVLCCFAAGNAYHGPVGYPAAYSLVYDNVIAVSATDHDDQSSSFSSVGPEVTVSAPGGYGFPFDEDDVYSTMPNYTVYLNISEGISENYGYLAGTSMSCPHVAGLAGLILSVDPSLTPAVVRNLIISSADDLGPEGFDNEFGYGRISCYNALLQMGELNIGHIPLANTKDSANPIRVDCTIFSLADLVTDSLLLHYNTGSGWNSEELLVSKALHYYHAYIPAQPPGSNISYYLTAKNVDGLSDSTEIYQFSVIDYQMFMEPYEQSRIKSAPDTVWYPITVTNDGVYDDSYDITVVGSQWTTTVWNKYKTAEITNTGSIDADDDYTFNIKVEIPVSYNGEYDSIMVLAHSASDPEQYDSSFCITSSYGVPLDFPFTDNFNSAIIDSTAWVLVRGAEIDSNGIAEPSPPYALRLNGDPLMGDTVMSQIIDMSSPWAVLEYYYQQTGGGESPDVGDDLFVEYFNEYGEWIVLNQHYGSGPDMTTFQHVSLGIPDDGRHDQFRIRFRCTASNGERDDWFVDNIYIHYTPTGYFEPSGSLDVTLAPNDSAARIINITKSGMGVLYYEVEIEEDYSPAVVFNHLRENASVEPSSRYYPPEYYNTELTKETEEFRSGGNVTFNAGGPDQFGYIWLDSDDPNGPDFQWIDISQTGTLVEDLSDDSYAGPISLDFDFEFYGETYSEIYVSSNGFVGFGPPENYSSPVNDPIPVVDIPGNLIALLWDDLNIQDSYNPGGEIRYQLVENSLVISYLDMPEYMADSGDVFTGQIILNPNGSILLQYAEFGSGFEREESTIGIEDAQGFDGLEIAFNTEYLKDSLAVLITQPDVKWLQANPQSGSLASGSDEIELMYSSNGYWSDSLKATITITTNCPNPYYNPWVGTAFLYVVPPYFYGDANNDENVNVTDAVVIINYIFIGGYPPDPLEAGDANCDGAVNISDAVRIINYIFNSAPAPCIEDE